MQIQERQVVAPRVPVHEDKEAGCTRETDDLRRVKVAHSRGESGASSEERRVRQQDPTSVRRDVAMMQPRQYSSAAREVREGVDKNEVKR